MLHQVGGEKIAVTVGMWDVGLREQLMMGAIFSTRNPQQNQFFGMLVSCRFYLSPACPDLYPNPVTRIAGELLMPK